ncbi:response regulator [Telmatospirillum siberiense]|uniref:DNA-binding response regulator n=1 Tax=Telmatospirillum siberiense TaxID=382514 RepID=A0A2N3PWB9_9PROT|nr:response regulator [Telmatospirillum siberiense]PKU24691.1 DNA-binding response regulator [Telmatospirillum siberiense]
MKLLLIDDSPTDLRLLVDMLRGRHMRVSVALDGDKGYQLAALHRPELILLDVRMPGMDGFATCRRLKANPATQRIPVIFLTAANDLDERLEGFSLGAVDYIGKPFSEEEVLARVGVHLNSIPMALPSAAEEASATSRDEVLARAAQKILGDRIADPPSLQELAELLGTNRSQISKSFLASCHQPVFGWLREERLRQAYSRVCRGDTSILLIAEHLGYSSAANFTKAFRERFGLSPRDLREDMRARRHLSGTSPEPRQA